MCCGTKYVSSSQNLYTQPEQCRGEAPRAISAVSVRMVLFHFVPPQSCHLVPPQSCLVVKCPMCACARDGSSGRSYYFARLSKKVEVGDINASLALARGGFWICCRYSYITQAGLETSVIVLRLTRLLSSDVVKRGTSGTSDTKI